MYGAPGYTMSRPGAGGALPPMSLPKNVIRVQEGALWSTWELGVDNAVKASTIRQFFGQQIGAQGQGFARALDFVETNMREGGRIPAGLTYTISAISMHPYASSNNNTLSAPLPATELYDLQANSALQWKLFGTEIDVAPSLLIGQGGGVFGATADTGAAYGPAGVGSQVALNHGAGQVWVYAQQPLMLPAQQTFSLDLRFGPDAAVIELNAVAAQRLRIRVSLLGKFAQAVAIG